MKAIRSRLYRPRPCEVVADGDGAPVRVDGVAVDAIREEWMVQDTWWTDKPLDRRYFEAVLVDGHNIVVFAEGDRGGRWLRHRA